MTNTPLTVVDASGTSITVLSDDYGLGFSNAAGTSTQLVGIDNGDIVTFAAAISTLPAGDFLFLTSAIKQDRFVAGQAIAINKDLFKKCVNNASGSTIVFKRIYGTLKVTEDKANVDAQLTDTSGGSTPTQTAATTTTAGVGGKTSNPPIDGQNKFFKGDATFGVAIPAWNNTTNWEVGDVVYNSADNKVYRVTTAHVGGSFSSGNFAELSPSVAGSALTVTTVGTAIFQYEILTGTPVIGYTKTGGAGNGVMTCTGGTIKLRQFTDDIVAADMAASPGSIRFDLVGTGTVAKLARSFIPTKYTLNATDALADASTSGTTSNQVDIDNTPPVKYGNIVLTSHGAMSIRLDNVTPDMGISFKW